MNSKLRVRMTDSRSIGAAERRAIERVFTASFATGKEPERALDAYFNGIEHLLLAEHGGEIVGFQFFQTRTVGGRDVHHFSLSGRLSDPRFRGLQARFGSLLIRRAAWKALLWRRVYLAGVCNSSRSYTNLYQVGGRRYPDVLRPAAENPFGSWFHEVAAAIGISPDSLGLIPDRLCAIGFGLKPQEDNCCPLSDAYRRYVDGDLNRGVFTVVEIRPILNLPFFLAKRGIKRLTRRKFHLLEVKET